MQRKMFQIKCTECGQTATVPFEPTAGKPVYCRTCFAKHMPNRTQNVGRSLGLDQKQVWARRRDNGEERKEEKPTSIFHRP
jgi:CxxC-x17-CxxC domain-containing protein